MVVQRANDLRREARDEPQQLQYQEGDESLGGSASSDADEQARYYQRTAGKVIHGKKRPGVQHLDYEKPGRSRSVLLLVGWWASSVPPGRPGPKRAFLTRVKPPQQVCAFGPTIFGLLPTHQVTPEFSGDFRLFRMRT